MKNDLNRLTIGISLILIITVVLTYIIMHQNDYNNLVANISDTTPTTTDITTETSITDITTEETILTTEIITEEPYTQIEMTTIPIQEVTTTETPPLTFKTTQIETEVTSMDMNTNIENYNNIDNYYSSNFISYYNNDFQYSIAYPENFYIVSSSNDGCTFTNGFATIETYAYYNYEDTCESLYNQDINYISEEISYKLLKDDYYILSWVQNGNVIYRKVFVTNTRCVTLEYVYSYDYKSIYDSMIETMKHHFEIHN